MDCSGKTGQVGLKYCERCGGLWLRPEGESTVLCTGCAVDDRDFPRWWSAKIRAQRKRMERNTAQEAGCDGQWSGRLIVLPGGQA